MSDLEKPICKVFGECGGCLFQDKTYGEELRIKEEQLKELMSQELNVDSQVYKSIMPSPEIYHYRNRVDMTIRKRGGDWRMGYVSPEKGYVIEVDQCPIARKEISDFLPQLKEKALATMPDKYRNANLVVRSGEEEKVFWGGIGKRSLRMDEENYFFATVNGKKIFYSLDTFFQANLYILDSVIETIQSFLSSDRERVFFDLYSGVGLFGIALADDFNQIVMIEESPNSIHIAKHNKNFHKLDQVEVCEGKVEEILPNIIEGFKNQKKVAMIDPPRKGLHPSAREFFKSFDGFDELLYLSCSPESLVRDLKELTEGVWEIEQVIPFDFFPRTKHLETLVKLRKN